MTGSRVRLSAYDIARATGAAHLPTPEQVAVIEAPLAPLLVVAGAGSGKTETMAARVVWLVANRIVRPDEVLGLTFTRKAAGELAERITGRLAVLRESGLWHPEEEVGAPAYGDLPTVSTYHAYAGRLVREHGVRLGLEAESRLLTEAAAWQLAHEVVHSWEGPLDEVVKAASTVTNAVVDLSGELAEHLVTPDQLAAHLAAVQQRLESLVRAEGSRRRGLPPEIREALAALSERRAIVPLLTAYARAKAERDAMDFADQMAVAARLALQFPAVGAEERSRHRAVLLDEFQDTSEAQLVMLRALFVSGQDPAPVTAVGDPHQSIYGWRGASATTLRRFRTDFATDGQEATVLPLSTSWRNDRAILEVANAVAGPLRASSVVPVEPLRARPGAGPGHVATARLETIEDEAHMIVDWLLARRSRPGRSTAAVLCRKRSQFDPIVAALEARGVPHEVVGLGGLLHTPEIADLVALLWVVQDPSRGDHLMRLLTGPVLRLGAADLDGLAAWSRARHRAACRPHTVSGGAAAGDAPTPDEGVPGGSGRDLEAESVDEASLIEALDDLPAGDWSGPEGERLSAVARARLIWLGDVIRRLRRSAGGPLVDLLIEAEEALDLDIEVLARPHWSVGAARAHLDAFADVVAGFAGTSDRPTLGGLLDWLAAAADEERGLDLGWIETSPGAVQVMTVHAAKGLEWDVVAVPGLVESTFPAHSSSQTKPVHGVWTHAPVRDRGWLGGLAALPHDLRGDRDGLPRFPWDTVVDWDEAAEAHADYLARSGDRSLAEERRLAYVALTRARSDLLLTAHIWGSAGTPRLPSRFLTDVDDTALTTRRHEWADLPDADPIPSNPRLVTDAVVAWPPAPARDPDGVWRRAGQQIDSCSPAEGGASPAPEVDEEVTLLLAEREARSRHSPAVELPAHLSTTALLELADDADAFALRVRRPMPQAPAVSARQGQAFHAWVEQHFGRAAFLDPLDLPGAGDDGDAVPFEGLRAHFLASAWADRIPVEVEVPVETVISGVAVRGRVDAVFVDPDDPTGYVLVDWKSGRPPTGARAEMRALQLAVYRVAWARLRGVPEDKVRGAFFHAATGETSWPDLAGVERLEQILSLGVPAV